MSVTALIVTVVVLLAVGLFVFRAIPAIRAYFQYRGKRLITCPESHTCEAVDVNAKEAAVGAFLTEPTLRLKECSRWPEREACGQECLQQIEVDAQNCLVWSIVSKWYEGKTCVFCHKEIGPLHHLDHAPALLAPDFPSRLKLQLDRLARCGVHIPGRRAAAATIELPNELAAEIERAALP